LAAGLIVLILSIFLLSLFYVDYRFCSKRKIEDSSQEETLAEGEAQRISKRTVIPLLSMLTRASVQPTIF
jgi:hypothetical protein